MDLIRFYEGPYACLSNFSAHRVRIDGGEYMTAEHAYQTAKFQDPAIRQRIQHAPSAFLAREYGQVKEGRRRPLDKAATMRAIMRAKLLQHDDIRSALLATGDARIEKNHPDDTFWGTGADGTGQNVMGNIWMELRKELHRGAL